MLTKNHFAGEDEGEKPKEILIVDPDTEVCITVIRYFCSYEVVTDLMVCKHE
jgi:hypothetical protein